MSKSTKTIVPIIVVGILLAAGIIGGVTVLQQRGILPGLGTPHSNTGTLILLLHDPPNVPNGVSAIYVNYSDLSIHIASDSDNAGWIDLNQSGVVDLMSVVNFTQTIANVKVDDGVFNLFRMNISSAIITYNSVNYTASVASGRLTVEIPGGVEVSDAQSTIGTLMDISPTVIMRDSNQSSPTFALIPAARAFVVPQDQLAQGQEEVGHHENDQGETWLSHDEEHTTRANLSLSAVALSNSSLSLTVKNSGNASAIIQTIFVAANVTDDGVLGDGLNVGGSIIFSILANGTLVPLGHERDLLLGEDMAFGYNISAGASVNFTYAGPLVSQTQTTEHEWSTSSSGDHFATTTSLSGDHTGSTNTSANFPALMADMGTNTSSTTTHSENTTTHSELTATITTSSNTESRSGESTSASQTQSGETHSEILVDSSQTNSEEFNLWSQLQVISGQTYVVGLVSGDTIATATVIAS